MTEDSRNNNRSASHIVSQSFRRRNSTQSQINEKQIVRERETNCKRKENYFQRLKQQQINRTIVWWRENHQPIELLQTNQSNQIEREQNERNKLTFLL